MNTKSTPKLLLVEDNPGDVRLMQETLKHASFRHDLYTSDSLFDAFEKLKVTKFDLVLLDLSLPDSTGFKTLTSLLEVFPHTPVVVLTGVNNEIVGSQSVKAGAQDFLVKGQFDPKILGRSIRYAIQRHRVNLKLKESAKALAMSEKRFQEAQEIARFGNWELDIVSNKMKWSDEVYKILGLQPRSINPTLTDYINFIHSEDRKEVELFFDEASQKGKELKKEHRIVVDGRNIKHVALRAKIYFDEDTNKVLLMGVIQDISERKISEQLLLEKSINKKATKLKEDALADIGFHIRTPLSSIVNLLYVLEKSNSSNSSSQVIDDLKTSVADLSLMVNNLLNASLLASDELQVTYSGFELMNFLQSSKKMLDLRANNAGKIVQMNIQGNIPEQVSTDAQKLTQIFFNLFDVLFKNIGVTRINITIGWDPENNTLDIQTKEDGHELTRSEITELLSSQNVESVEVDPNNIELTRKISCSIINILRSFLNGTLSIQSQNGWNQYNLNIPMGLIKEDSVQDDANPTFPLKVLLVEDHFLNQIATKKVLTTWSDNISVDIAENGLVAVEKFKEHGYDIILMDIQMPVMNGIEATEKIREYNTEVPIIALTANASNAESEKCLAIGMNEYISKPFKPEKLYAKINKVLNRKIALV